jgi:amino acid adenylation domain-containing protein
MKNVLQSASIPNAFKAITGRFPDAVALQSGTMTLTYQELDRLSDELAARLVVQGVLPGARVGTSVAREAGTIVTMLGILKAGAAYVPLPDHYPADRLLRIVTEAGIGVLLGKAADFSGVATLGLKVIAPISDPDAPTGPVVLPEPGPEDLAYVMFTSGSTGTPKGVMVPQRAVLRLVQGQDFMALGPEERILQYAPMAFDAATLEIWGALLNGGTLVLPGDGQLSLRDLGDVLRQQRITTIWLTAGLFHAMADERPQDFALLRQLVTGGDVVSPAAVAKVLAACPDLVVINGYGPTENTTFTCCHRITAADLKGGAALPIGKPIRGTQVHLVDTDLNPVAKGAEGELCAAGEGLALGYLGRPDLTAEKFVTAPWGDGTRLYRTGDLARMDKNGTVHFLGRADAQVKLRGYRVELGEVEAAMQSVPGVGQAVAVARPGLDGADRMLVGFYVADAGFDAGLIGPALAALLPTHAVPQRFVRLDAVPLNPNGKADRAALAAMPLPAAHAEKPTAARPSEVEDRLIAHLADVLGLADPDPNANFFDLGASSLHLARVHNRLERDLGRDVPITDFFQYSSIRALARHLSSPAPAAPVQQATAHRAGDGLIAIVGMAGRFPGAADVATFWQGLLEGREMISHFGADELDFDPRPLDPDAPYVLARGVMNKSADFDARHFGVPPREAERMDPQHRILLEVAQTALENAGHDPDRFAGRIGIFAGSSQNSYLLNNLVSAPGAARALAAGYPVKDFATLFGNDKDFIATRIAYKLNLRGPAVTVQCACSTSLVAVGQACDALRRGQADMALAGGVSITFPARRPYLYTPDGMASADGHCRTFDAAATGTVFGDGAALVVLRRLEDALADGDEVIAVIRGHAINNDGSDKAGFAAPSIRAQADVIRAAHQAAGVEPSDIGYVEAHGTGTPLGDPIEFAALRQAFGDVGAGSVALGTAKTNVGHLDIAAGVTGLIKAALTLRHGEMPALLHYERPNPNIDFAASPFFPLAERRPWARGTKVRRAGVSAFGVGGTNIHMVLEEAPAGDDAVVRDDLPVADAAGPVVFPLSASSPDALNAVATDLGAWAGLHPDLDPRTVAATLRTGRRHYPHRAVLVADGMADLARLAAEPVRAVTAGRADRIAFLFPGQGAQHFGMGRDLYANAPVFRAALDECAERLVPDLGVNLIDILLGPESARDEMTARLKDTAIAQPAIFSMGYALARQWAEWGVTPDIMLGHSIGELAAATLAGVLDLPDALHLIALRGRLMADLPGGVMLSVRASEADLAPFLLNGGLDLAAVNGPRASVLAGPEAAAAAMIPELEAAGFVTSRLHTSHAFHSHMMEPAVVPFRKVVAGIALRAPTIPILSTVTGDWLTAQEATDPGYWAGHMRRPVRFLDALQGVWSEGRHLMIETGPGRTLSTLAAQNPDRDRLLPAIPSLPHAQATEASSHHSMLEAFGLIWANGMPVDWARLGDAAPKARGLPTYPFQRKTFWVEPVDALSSPTLPGPATPQVATSKAETALADAPGTADALREMLAELSGIEPAEMGGTVSFLGLGFDSLLLTQATRELSDRFGVAVSLRELIDGYATIDALAAHIDAVGARKPKPGAKPVVAENDGAFVAKQAPVAETPTSAPMTRIKADAEDLSDAQKAHVDALVARYVAKTRRSKELTAQYRPVHADPRTASGFNRAWKEIVYQIVTVKSKGSRLIDVDGNEYIDLLNGFGPGFLGHSAPPVVAALRAQLEAGFEVGPQSLIAMEAADLFCRMTGNDRASFVCTGSEAVYAAMRLARTVTARDRIVMFARDYHGNFDEVLVRSVDGRDGPRTLPLAPGIPRDSVKNVIVLPYGTAQSLDWIRDNADTLAAVIVEPVQSRRPEFRPVEFVREVRRITENAGALMIFDEVVTGFRFGPRGAQGYYNVTADLVTYGKVVGGGLPVGVVSGKARFMDTFDGGQWAYGDDSFPQAPVTFFAGTFVRHPLAMAAVRAMLTHLAAQPDFFWQTVNSKGDRLAGTVDRWFADNDMPFQMPNCGSLMYLRIAEDQPHGALIGAHLRDRGVFLLEGFPSYVTAAHDDQDIDHAIAAFKDAALEMRAGGMLTGREAVAYKGPLLRAAPARLSLPGEEERMDAAMVAPLGSITAPTTEAQREIWAAMIVTPELAPAYNESVTLRLRGVVDLAALKATTEAGLARHDAFRATFSADGSEMQVKPAMRLPVALTDLSGQPAAALEALREAEVTTPFDMQAGPFVRAQIVVLGPDLHDLVITAHHIVCDGWSIDVVMRDIGALYSAMVAGRRPDLPPAQSILDFARVEAEWARSDAAAADEAHWLHRFRDPGPVLDLPTDRPRGDVRGVLGARKDQRLPEELVTKLRALARSQGVSFVNLLLAAWKVHVARLADVSDITIGLPAAGQAARGLPQVVGHCVNLMPIRSQIDWKAGFDRYLGAVRDALLDAYDHQNYTYGALVRALKLPRDPARVMLVPVVFNIDKGIDLSEMTFGQAELEFTTNPRRYEHFDLYLNVTDTGHDVVTEWSYKTDLFDPETISRQMEQFVALLRIVAKSPSIPLASVARKVSRSGSVVARQPKAARAPTDKGDGNSLARAFARSVAAHPEAAAVTDPAGESLSYARLDSLSDGLAARLVADGVKPGDLVGITAERSVETIIGLLAIVKSGAGYVPLPDYFPAERLRLMAVQANVGRMIGKVPALAGMGITEFEVTKDAGAAQVFVPVSGVNGESLAYVMYTSGSTGTPKGVMVPHRGILRLVLGQDFANLGPDERILQYAPMAFDAATLEIWGALLNGGTLVLAPPGQLSLSGLGDLVRDQRITTLWLTTGLFHAMADERPQDFATLRQLLTGGDVVSPAAVGRVLAACPDLTLIVAYGPTENTTFTTCHRITPADLASGAPLPIGRPIRGTQVYVTDAEMNLLPADREGELCTAGEGLALGYLGRDDLTAEKFVTPPWSNGRMLYRTGDLARIDQSGVVHFLGRIDSQVKIRGFRVEPGEIEAALETHPAVRRAVVRAVALRARAEVSLLAYVQFAGAPVDRAAMLDHARKMLPDYACPQHIIPVDTFPLNPNGKVDLRALPLPDPEALSIDTSTAQTDVERRLAAIWVETLDIPRIGVETDFFELGGHSLLAVKLFSKIRRTFGIDLPISTLFAHPTIRSLAGKIEEGVARDALSLHGGAPEDSPWDTSVVIHQGPRVDAAGPDADGQPHTRRPLFIVGGVGGNVNNLHELGQLVGRTRPLIGLQTRGVLGHRMHETLEAMAADHISHIRRHQPEGPYLISGYSGGGLTAFEIARQLEQSGEVVAFLGVLDAYAPGFQPEREGHARARKMKDRLTMLVTEPRRFLQRGLPWLRDKVLTDRLVEVLTPLAPERMRLIGLARSWMRAAAAYDPRPFGGDVWLFQTMPETPLGVSILRDNPDYGWKRLIRGRIARLEHQSNHFSMLTGTDATELSEWIEVSISEGGGDTMGRRG